MIVCYNKNIINNQNESVAFKAKIVINILMHNLKVQFVFLNSAFKVEYV